MGSGRKGKIDLPLDELCNGIEGSVALSHHIIALCVFLLLNADRFVQ